MTDRENLAKKIAYAVRGMSTWNGWANDVAAAALATIEFEGYDIIPHYELKTLKRAYAEKEKAPAKHSRGQSKTTVGKRISSAG